jgi:hypothetical protein
VHDKHSDLFIKPDDPENETEEERKQRLEEEKEELRLVNKWNWYRYFYVLAKGDITKIPDVVKLNFMFTLTHRSFEIENKKLAEYYDFRRYSINGE